MLASIDETILLREIFKSMDWSLKVQFSLAYSYLAIHKSGELRYIWASKSIAMENHMFQSKREAIDWISTYKRPTNLQIMMQQNDIGLFTESGLSYQKTVACFVWIRK